LGGGASPQGRQITRGGPLDVEAACAQIRRGAQHEIDSASKYSGLRIAVRCFLLLDDEGEGLGG
jgi:hypothetical protein